MPQQYAPDKLENISVDVLRLFWKPVKGLASSQYPRGAYSLRRRLIAAVLSASILLWVTSLGIIVYVAWKETSDVFDDSLKEGGRLILGASLNGIQHGGAGSEIPADPDIARVRLYYQVISDGRMIRHTERAPAEVFVPDFEKMNGFANVYRDGTAWRVYVVRSRDRKVEVQIAQPLAQRLEILHEVTEKVVIPALVLLVLLGTFTWLAIQRLIRPIEDTARAIAEKSPGDLTPVELSPLSELMPIVNALNRVLARLASALQAERRFTADAAHELRTPLAALRMKTQLLQRQYPEQQASMQALRNDIDRCTGLVESLLMLARIDECDELGRETIAVDELLNKVLASTAALAREKQIDVRLASCMGSIEGNAQTLEIALRNLLDNALRYCPPHSTVEVAIARDGNSVRLSVRDNGPGIAPPHRQQLVERFFRVLGTGQSGSGLGLSIVQRIVALHRGTLSFENGLEGNGLGVIVDLPASSQ